MKFNENINTLSTICIILTFIYSIVLIVDELFNIGYFTYKYTYLYNYGTFIDNFNNTQSIEYETNRFNVYNNIDKFYLYKDNFNMSYFNYLIIVIAILLTIIICVGYAVFFYDKFIYSQPESCSFTPDDQHMSYIKQFMRCICDNCHEIIPNCSFNYIVLLILLILIPSSYLFKLVFKVDFTPSSNTSLFNIIYILLFIVLLFYYSYVLYSNSNDENKLITTISYILLTIIFIASGYIFKYIYNTYTGKIFNTTTSSTLFYDIYKQSAPVKPKQPIKPIYKGKDVLKTFVYKKDNDEKDPDYDMMKTLYEEYNDYLKNYDNEMKIYTEKYNIYKNTLTQFPAETNIISIIITLLGLDNKTILIIYALLISLFIFSAFLKEDDKTIINLCIKYTICILTIIILLNAILYYNTYINKYIIYEPLAHYKNDIAIANTKLNLLIDSSDGDKFYKKLTNSGDSDSSTIKSGITTKSDILESITELTYDPKQFNSPNLKTINSNIVNVYNVNNPDIDNNNKEVDGYFRVNVGESYVNTIDYFYTKIFTNISNYSNINNTPSIVQSFNFYFNENQKRTFDTTNYFKSYYSYIYYDLILQKSLCNSILSYTQLTNIYANILKKNINKIDNIIKSYNLQQFITLNKDGTDKYSNDINNVLTNKIQTVNDNKIKSITDTINIIYNKLNNINISSFYILTKIIDFEYDSSSVNKLDIKVTSYSVLFITGIVNTGTLTNALTDNKDISQFSSNSNYYKLPVKITDNNNNEYKIKFTPTTGSNIIVNYFVSTQNERKDLMYDNNKLILSSSNKYYRTAGTPDTIETISSQKQLPLKCYYYNGRSIISTILNVFYNKLYNLKTAFSYITLQQNMLYSADLTDDKLYNTLWTGVALYNNLFNTASTYTPDSGNIYTIVDYKNDNLAFIILLYNIYLIDTDNLESDIRDTLDYIIYNDINITTNFNNFKSDNLKSFDSIKSKINYNNKSDNITIYNNNSNIISIIIKLFKNLIAVIKSEIFKSTKLCKDITTAKTKLDKEVALYKYITSNYDITSSRTKYNDALTIAIKSSPDDTKLNDAINKLNNIIKYYFNICIFLLKNGLSTDTSNDEMSGILDGYKFYNTDNSNIVKEILYINSNYYNKYYKLTTKQISQQQVNIDNVSYNFIILMIIFLLILGEPIFIKS
jgi:hypothetical protein